MGADGRAQDGAAGVLPDRRPGAGGSDAVGGYVHGGHGLSSRALGVTEPETGSPRLPLYNACVNALVLDAWDNRAPRAGGKGVSDNPAFRRKLNQLKLTEPPVSESDTGQNGGTE